MKGAAVRVALVDDSALARLALRRLLSHDPAITIVCELGSGESALRRLPEVEVDVVLMDVVLPGIDGLETTRRLMASCPRPILVVSALAERDARLGFRALEAGALDLAAKPSSADLDDPAVARRWCRRVRVLAGVPVITRHQRPTAIPAIPGPAGPLHRAPPSLVAIGTSTGGPPAIRQILDTLGAAPPWPMVVVQHITPGFTASLGQWLGDSTGRTVQVVETSAALAPGVVYLAPDGRHLELRHRTLVARPGPPHLGHCPSVDVLFESLASSDLAPATVAVLLTGMGSDGAAGLLALRRAGASTLAQDEASSVVYGMPRAAAELGAARRVLCLDAIAQHLRELSIRPA